MLAIGNLVPMVPPSLSDETASDSKTSSSSTVINLMDTGTYISLTHLYLMAKRLTYPSELHLLLCFIVFYFPLFLGCEVRYFFFVTSIVELAINVVSFLIKFGPAGCDIGFSKYIMFSI